MVRSRTVKPLRILHVAPFCAEAWGYGGIPRVVGRLASGLVVRGHHVTVCATDACDERSRVPAGERQADGVALRIFPNLWNGAAFRWQAFLPLGMAGWLQRHAAGFDVAHLHACRNLPTAFAARRLHRAGVPYAFSPHGTAPLIERRRAIKWIFDRTIGRGALDHALRVVAVSDAEQRDLIRLGIAESRIRVVENPLGMGELEAPARGAFRRRARLTGSPLVAYLGQLSPRKHIDQLVHAFAALDLPNAGLVIAGPDRGCLAELRALVRRLGLEERTRFFGTLVGRERLEMLRDADVVAYPGAHEVFGLVLVESLGCGTPVVVADDSGARDLIVGLGGGLSVAPGDSAALAAGLRVVLADLDGFRARAIAAGHELAKRCAEPVVIDRLEAVYAELLAGAGGRA